MLRKSFVFLLVLLVPLKAIATTFDWDVNAWPSPVAGVPTLSQTYPVAGGNVTITITGDTGALITTPDGSPASPESNAFQTGGIVPAENGLFLRMDFPEGAPPVNAQSISVTFSFSHPGGINLPQFDVFDIDSGPNQWIDVAQVTAMLAAGGTVNPTNIISGASNTNDGINTATGTGGAGNTSADGNLEFVFGQSGVSSYTFTYSNNVPNVAGSHNQWASIHDFDFFVPPTVLKSFSPNSITSGEVSTLTLTLGNTETSNATLSANLVDTLPAGVTVASPANIGGTCPGTTNAPIGGNTITYTNGSVIPTGTCTITVDVTSATPGTHTNTIPVGDLQTNFGNNTVAANDDLVVNAATPSISKSFATDPIAFGGTSALTITLDNVNAVPATLTAALIDTLPNAGNGDLVIAAVPNIGGTCNNADVTAVAGATTITFANGATIPAGGCTITVDVTSSVVGTHTNTIPAGALQTDLGNNPVAATDDITVNAALAPSVSKVFSPNSIALNAISTLTITLGNTNGVDAVLISALVDTLPTAGNSDVVVATVPNIGGTCASASVTAVAGATTITYASGATIPAGGCTINVDVTSATAGNYTNTIAAGALQTDLGNNVTAASDNLAVTAFVPPTVTKSYSPISINPGGTSQLTISLSNANPNAITLSANLDDNLPGGVSATAVNGTTTCTAGSVDISLNTRIRYVTGAVIPAGGCNIVVDVTSNTLGITTNTIPAGALQTNAGSNANPTSDNLTVTAGGGAPTCPAGTNLVTLGIARNADAVAAGAGVPNASEALGSILASGSGLNNGNSARLRNVDPTIVLDLTDTVPENATIILSIARNNNGANYDIDSSINVGGPFSGTINFAAAPNDISQQISYTVPSGGARYVRFDRNGGSLWVDGVQYSQICEPIPVADLSITKDDGSLTYTPGSTGTYTILVTNNGPDDVTGATIVDNLPDGVTMTAPWACTPSSGSSSCNTAPSTTDPISIDVDIVNGDSITVTVPVSYSSDMTDY